MLIHFGIIPYIVFDGDYLPSKASTEVERAKRREESKRKGLELHSLNRPSQAHLELQKAVDVTPEMARQLIDELKKTGIQYVVAPYEADAQLVYLEKMGIIQGILSEDSDLLVFGAKRLLTKLDHYGECVEINRADFATCREISLVGWSDAEFRRMAILSGCDYLANINRMGLKSAYRIVRKYKKIEKIVQMLQFDGQYCVPTDYLAKFYRAELTFLHQRVFCPIKNEVVMMTELGEEAQPEDFSFIGNEVEKEIATGVAKGDLDPMTKQPIYVREPVTSSTPKKPWPNSNKRMADKAVNSKAGKSIDSFFKAKRTPLAELDPNTFTPSPTQARLLQQARVTTWESSPVTDVPPGSRSSVSMAPSTSRPALLNRSRQAVNTAGGASSGLASSKRRRLCIDAEDSQNRSSAAALESTRSRFFPSSTMDPSPSVKVDRNVKRSKPVDINIWSDDSIEDVMAGLPNVGEMFEPLEKRKVEVFKDDGQEGSENHQRMEFPNDKREGEDSQSSNASTGTSEALASTAETNFTSSATSVGQTLKTRVSAEQRAISQKFTYQPETERMASQRREIQQDKNARSPESAVVMPTKPLLQRQRSLTPLQRLGVGALNRSKSCTGLPSNVVHTPENVNVQITFKGDITAQQKIPTLPTAHSMGLNNSVARGSEDTIIPDSEGSADDADSMSEAEGQEQSKPRLHLENFAFTG